VTSYRDDANKIITTSKSVNTAVTICIGADSKIALSNPSLEPLHSKNTTKVFYC
jgi:hypothetical protein